MNVADCGYFIGFLPEITRQGSSHVHVQPGAPGWAPFSGALIRNSQVPSDGAHRSAVLAGYGRRAAGQLVATRQPEERQ